MPATSRKSAPSDKSLSARRKLCIERRDAEHAASAHDALRAKLDARLKVLATEAGESFTERFDNGDEVRVSPGCAAEFRGDVPVVVSEAWIALAPAEKKKLQNAGLIKLEPNWGRASSGRVTVKIF